jgi:hypothetical protein
MSDDDAISLTVEVTRGTSTDDRDKMRATVSGSNMDEVARKVARLREQMEEWAEEFRAIQPDGTVRDIADDQATLAGGEA